MELRPGRQDLVAGISVAVVLVPQSLAYAQLAGMPAYRGLFAAAIPPLVAAPLASSPYLQPGPTAVSALLTFGALSPLAPVGSTKYVELGLLLALLVGLVRLGVGLLQAGVLAYLLSESLLVGFVPAAAILIAASQLPVALGSQVHGQNSLYSAAWSLAHAASWQSEAVGATVIAAVALAASRKLHPLFPGVLLIIVAAAFYGEHGGYDAPKVGHFHAGLPPLTTRLPLGELPHLIAPAVVIALLGFAEATSIARRYAAVDRRRWDADREFVSQGAANIASGMFGGFPVGASFSRSALNRLAGAQTSASALVTGLAVLAFLPLGFLLAPLPRAVLAATVIVAVVPLMRLTDVVEIIRLSRPQATITLAAFLLTLAFAPHLEKAILVAIGVSIVIHLWRELRLDIRVARHASRLEASPQGVLWFGNARVLEDRVVELLSQHPDAAELEIRLDGLGRIDLAGAFALRTLLADARQAGLSVSVVGAPQHAARVLRRVLGEAIGKEPGAEPLPSKRGDIVVT